MRIKGSQVVFPLSKIEGFLDLNHRITQKEDMLNSKRQLHSIANSKQLPNENGRQPSRYTQAAQLLEKFREKDRKEEITIAEDEIVIMKKMVNQIIYDLLKPEYLDQSIAPELLKEARKRKKKLKHGQ